MHLRPGKEHTEEAGGRVIRSPNGDHPHFRVLPSVHPAVRNMAQRAVRVAWVARTDRKGLLAAVGREAVRDVQRVAVLYFCSKLGPLPATTISSSFKADRSGAEEATIVNLRYKVSELTIKNHTPSTPTGVLCVGYSLLEQAPSQVFLGK